MSVAAVTDHPDSAAANRQVEPLRAKHIEAEFRVSITGQSLTQVRAFGGRYFVTTRAALLAKLFPKRAELIGGPNTHHCGGARRLLPPAGVGMRCAGQSADYLRLQ